MPSPLRDDLLLAGYIPLRLYRPRNGPARGIDVTDQPQLATDQFIDADLPARQETWHLGAGYSLRLLPGTYAYANNGDGRMPRIFMPGPQMNLVTLTGSTDYCRWGVDVGTSTYIGGGQFTYFAANGSMTSPKSAGNDFGAGAVSVSAVNFKGSAWIGSTLNGTAGPLMQIQSSGTSTIATANRSMLTTAYYNSTNGFRLFGLTDTAGNNIVKTVDPGSDPTVDGNWGTPITFGDASGITINKLVALQDHVYAGTDRGLFDFDGSTGQTFNVTPQWAQRRDSENGVACHVGDQWVYWGHKHGLARYQAQGLNAGIVQSVSFGRGLPNETPIRGQVTASCQDQGWTVQAIWNGSDTYVCYGRDIAAGDQAPNPNLGLGYGATPQVIGPSPMLWHGGIIKLAGLKCYCLFISGQTDPPKLWVGAGSNVQWCYLPRTENPQQDPDYRFATSYSVYMPYEDWGRPATNKNLIQLDVEGDNLGIGAQINFRYSVDSGGYSALGTANTNPLVTLRPGSEIIGRRISIAADGSNSPTGGANMRAYLLRAAERVTVRQLRTYQIDLTYDSGDRLGGSRLSQPLKTIEQLRSLCTAGAVSLRDEFGVTSTVLVKPPVEWREVIEGRTSDTEAVQPHLVATLRISIISSVGPGFNWDSGAKFNTGKVLA